MTTKPAKALRLLSRDEVLGAQDSAFEDIETPEWAGPGTGVRVFGLSGSERDKSQAGFFTFGPNDKGGMRVTTVNNQNTMARLVALAVRDAEGKRLFTDVDVLALGDKSAVALERVSDVAMRLSGLTTASMEALTERLKATQSDTSGTESPSP